MSEKDLKILKQMLELSKQLNQDYITFNFLQDEIKQRIDLFYK